MAANDSIPEAPVAPTTEEQSNVLIIPEGVDLLRVGLLGLGVGLLIPALSWVLHTYLLSPIFCRGGAAAAICNTTDLTAYYVAAVIMGVVSVALMANWQVFRPLLIAVAAIASLWGFQRFTGNTIAHAGLEYYITSAIMFAVVYLLFYWLLRLKSFALSVILTVVAVVLIRWVLLI